jgi:hypothetical protein
VAGLFPAILLMMKADVVAMLAAPAWRRRKIARGAAAMHKFVRWSHRLFDRLIGLVNHDPCRQPKLNVKKLKTFPTGSCARSNKVEALSVTCACDGVLMDTGRT